MSESNKFKLNDYDKSTACYGHGFPGYKIDIWQHNPGTKYEGMWGFMITWEGGSTLLHYRTK